MDMLPKFFGVALLLGCAMLAKAEPAIVTMTKSQWTQHMETTAPVHFCRKNSPWRTCYSVEAQECEEDMASATRVCLGHMMDRLPASLDKMQSEVFGSELGECVTNTFSTLHPEAARDTPECQAAIAKIEGAESGSSSNQKTVAQPQAEARHTSVRQEQELYSIVDRADLGRYWKQIAKAGDGPEYPMVISQGSSWFCVAVGFAIGGDGMPSNIHTLYLDADTMSDGLKEQVRTSSEKYVESFRFAKADNASNTSPVFTYTVVGRYRYSHGETNDGRQSIAYSIAKPCETAAKTALEKLRANSR